MLKTAFAAALLIGAASAAQAQTYTFSGLKGSTLTLSGSGVLTGTFSPKGGQPFDALGYANSYGGKGTIIVSTIDLAKGSDYDVIFVLAAKKTYTEYAAAQTAAFKKIGSGTYKTKK
jgi:hypothetical protein